MANDRLGVADAQHVYVCAMRDLKDSQEKESKLKAELAEATKRREANDVTVRVALDALNRAIRGE